MDVGEVSRLQEHAGNRATSPFREHFAAFATFPVAADAAKPGAFESYAAPLARPAHRNCSELRALRKPTRACIYVAFPRIRKHESLARPIT